jgi:hypothetical protein
MGGFTNNELNEINLGKNYKYPDTSNIETKARIIIQPIEVNDGIILRFTTTILFLMAVFIGILFYFRNNDMKIMDFFKSLNRKINLSKGKLVSSRTMIVPK